VRAAGEKLSAFFRNFVRAGGKYAYFLPIGEETSIFPVFSSPSNHFFPQHVIWPYVCPRGGGVKQKNIQTWT